MRKIEGVNWMEAYQAYCLSGLGLRGFITQEMYKFCSDEKIPSRGSVIRYFSEIKRQLENANTSADVLRLNDSRTSNKGPIRHLTTQK